ncbi:MAG TPA: RNA polymerase sigma-70 factor [Cyclobacteriaceae bacterium]
MNEKDLLELLRKDDPSAIKYIFDCYHPTLCMLAYRVLKDTDQAKDSVQDVFIRLWRNRQHLEITGSLAAYLKKATVNTALNVVKSRTRFNKQGLGQTDLSALASNLTEEDVFYKELTQKADNAINDLPERTRIVFTLIRSEEMSYKEVAATLRISTKAVEKEMMKALRLLRKALGDYLTNALVIALLLQA